MRVRAFCALAAIFFSCGVGFAYQSSAHQYGKVGINKMFLDAHTPEKQLAYSRSEVKKMIRDANTPEDFTRLADYFDYRAMQFEQKSQDQTKELQRLLALPYHARSYPVQVDHTRELIEQYKAQAKECSARAEVYREHATVTTETK